MACKKIWDIPRDMFKVNESARRVYSTRAEAPTINTCGGGRTHPKIGDNMLRIRKLTEGECYRLMGFERKDELACKAAGQSKSNIYHQAGDSIVTTVLMGIFGELLGLDHERKIEEYADRLHEEVE